MGKKEKARKQVTKQQHSTRQPLPIPSTFRETRGGVAEPTSALSHLLSERKQYAEKWTAGNAAKFEADGHYAWMASLLDGYNRVLEIGTGDGRGTLALMNAGHTVVGVDENPVILELAQLRLKEAGKSVVYEAREKVSLSLRGYQVWYGYPKHSVSPGGALLLNGDIQNDPKLIQRLRNNGPFDAVACWMIGTHHARTYNEVFDTINVGEVMEYRLSVQNRVYELAEELLRPGGVLQVVDRGQPLETEQIQRNYISNHKEQANVTSLEITGCEERYYEEASEDGVEIIPTTSDLSLIPAQSISQYRDCQQTRSKVSVDALSKSPAFGKKSRAISRQH